MPVPLCPPGSRAVPGPADLPGEKHRGAGPGPGGRSGAMAAGLALKHGVKERRVTRSAGRGRVTPDKTLPSFPWDISFILGLWRNLHPIPPHRILPQPTPAHPTPAHPSPSQCSGSPRGDALAGPALLMSHRGQSPARPPLSVTKVPPPLSPDRSVELPGSGGLQPCAPATGWTARTPGQQR